MALAKTRRYACVVALGAIVRGETAHFDYVASEAASGLQLAAIETGIPVAFGVLTVDTVEQGEADRPRRRRGALRARDGRHVRPAPGERSAPEQSWKRLHWRVGKLLGFPHGPGFGNNFARTRRWSSTDGSKTQPTARPHVGERASRSAVMSAPRLRAADVQKAVCLDCACRRSGGKKPGFGNNRSHSMVATAAV